jgi:hypothetical protein
MGEVIIMRDVNADLRHEIELLEHQQRRRREVWAEQCAEVRDVFERKQRQIDNLRARLS